MADTKDERARAWWAAWWAEDYSWAGLAGKRVGQNGRTVHGGLHGEKTLQDYWRRDPETGAVRDDAALMAAGELVEFDGTPFHIAHLPPRLKGGAPTWKANLKDAGWEKCEALIAMRIAAGAETAVDFTGDAKGLDGRAQLHGAVLRSATSHPRGKERPLHLEASHTAWLGRVVFDGTLFGPGARFESATFSGDAVFANAAFSGIAGFARATFSGEATFERAALLGKAAFASATFSGDAVFGRATFSGDAVFDRATFSGDARFDRATFSRDAWFDGATLSGHAEFGRATFSGPAGFHRATFSGDARFDRATFSGDARFIDARFERPASFRKVAFERAMSFERMRCQAIVWFDGAGFKHDMDFTAAIFERLASFENIVWPTDARHWHSAFDQTLFHSTIVLAGAGFRSFAAFEGATLERGVQIDDATETDAKQTFRQERAAAISAASADGDAWAAEEAARRKETDKEKAKPVTRREIAARIRDAREERLRQLERGCRVLKQAMENASNKSREQLLYRFELQARRAQRGLPPGEALFSDLYRWTSDYGASMVRPFATLFLLILAFAGAYFGWAWTRGAIGAESGQILASDAAWQALDLSWANVFKPLSALTSEGVGDDTVSAALLKKADAPTQFFVRALATLQSLFAIVLAFLFALAVRRRFQIS